MGRGAWITMYARLVGILCAIFVVVSALGCQNRSSVSQPSESERTTERDMSAKESELQQEVNTDPTLQEARESEIGAQPPTQEPVPESAAVLDSPADENETFANESDPLDIHCSEEDLDKDESKRWRGCYLGDEEQDKIRPIIAKALNVNEGHITLNCFGYAFGPWLSSFYVSGPYHVGELPADRVVNTFVIDVNSQTMLSPSKESVATIFRALKVLSDKPKPFPARAFALLLYWGMADKNMDLIESKRYRHRRGICVELTLETRPPQFGRYGIRQETHAYLITKDYDIEELPSCQ